MIIEKNNIDYFSCLPTAKLYIGNEEITKNDIDYNINQLEKSVSFYREYPDLFIDDVIKEPGSTFSLYFIQRILMRIFIRYRYVFATFNRGFSKSFIGILIQIIICILYPRSHQFIVAGTAEQGTKIADDKLMEILDLLPRLKDEIVYTSRSKPYEVGKDSLKVTFKNKSVFELVAALQSNRGRRMTGGEIEECVLVNGDLLSQVIIPMLNISRKVNGQTDPNEIHKRQLFVTSAGFKNTYSYDKLIQFLIWQALKDDNTAFILGGSYELAVKIGLLSKDFANEIKEDITYSDETFEREYGSKWSGTAEGSFFDAELFDKMRVLKNAVSSSNVENNINTGIYYVISVDVGRLNDRTIAMIFRVTPKSTGSTIDLVNIECYEEEHFDTQSFKLKQLVERYNAEVLILDGNGLGVGLLDYLVKPTMIYGTQEFYPPYSVINDERYDIYKTDDSIPMVYVIKSNSQEFNSALAANVLNQIKSKNVRFLISEKAKKAEIEAEEITKKNKKSSLSKIKELKPYIYTTSLKEEMMNLRRKNTLNNNIVLEQVNKQMHDDKYMSFAYGLYWIKLQDDNRIRNKRKKSFKNMVFFTKGR